MTFSEAQTLSKTLKKKKVKRIAAAIEKESNVKKLISDKRKVLFQDELRAKSQSVQSHFKIENSE